jgi:hypothetical protein
MESDMGRAPARLVLRADDQIAGSKVQGGMFHAVFDPRFFSDALVVT